MSRWWRRQRGWCGSSCREVQAAFSSTGGGTQHTWKHGKRGRRTESGKGEETVADEGSWRVFTSKGRDGCAFGVAQDADRQRERGDEGRAAAGNTEPGTRQAAAVTEETGREEQRREAVRTTTDATSGSRGKTASAGRVETARQKSVGSAEQLRSWGVEELRSREAGTFVTVRFSCQGTRGEVAAVAPWVSVVGAGSDATDK